MSDYAISYADLRDIERNLSSLQSQLSTINSNIHVLDSEIKSVDESVTVVNDNVKTVYQKVEGLANDFYSFVKKQMMANALAEAQREIIRIRQEIEKKYGHYDVVRRTTTGILQADDLAIVKKSTISTATEEMMITTPNYWLAPCLVALSAWISDQPELADRALKESIKRNDEKASLFWALVCRRAGRKQAALLWTQRYLENQDETNLDRKTIIILDAFASGLLGADSEGVIAKQLDTWMEKLEEKPGFIDQQTKQWSDAITMKRKAMPSNNYPYLRKYSKTWPELQYIMEGAMLHAEILGYFKNIFDQQASTDALKVQLDEILTSLVTDFDEEETPLRMEEKYNQFVIDNRGDVDKAKKLMAIEKTAFEEHKDFTQLLTDAAMKPESSHASVSTQKFSIALSRDWISNAYNDVVAQNRSKIPNSINITVDSFVDSTTDGQDEIPMLARYNNQINQEKEKALSTAVLTQKDNIGFYGGIAAAAIGLILLIVGIFAHFALFFGVICIAVGGYLIYKYFNTKKQIEARRQQIDSEYEKKRASGIQIVRATLAEVVDFRAEFAEKDAESEYVIDFLNEIRPEQYVRKLSESGRKINVTD